jgi:hypothetical protein
MKEEKGFNKELFFAALADRTRLRRTRRMGKWAHYRLVAPPDEAAARVFAEVRAWLESDPEMQSDRRRLTQMCCAPVQQQPVSIQGAPRPRGLAA